MPPSRRTFLKGLGVVTLAPALPGCSNSNDNLWTETDTAIPIPPRPVPSENFDFPIVSELPFAHGVASGDPLADPAGKSRTAFAVKVALQTMSDRFV